MAMTAKELLAKKSDLLKRKNAEIEVELQGVGDWAFYVPSSADIQDAQIFANVHGITNSDPVLVYQCLKEPKLNDPELVDALAAETGREKVAGPWMVEALLLPGQVRTLAEILLEQAGYSVDSARLSASTVDTAAQEDVMLGADKLKK